MRIGGTGPPGSVVFVAGKHPATELGGHSSYVRAHARAATAAGFRVRLHCVAAADGQTDTPYGTVYAHASPHRPFSPLLLPFHGPRLVSGIVRQLAGEPGPHLLHSFGAWGWVGIAVARHLARQGGVATPVLSAYATVRHDSQGKIRGLAREAGHPGYLRRRLEYLWYLGVIRRYERRACRGSRLVLLNYESVARLLEAEHGRGLPVRRIPYAPESAFDQDGDAVPAAFPTGGVPRIVAVSRHDPRKGVDVLLRALARLHHEGMAFRACLVGGGALLDVHRRYAARLGLDGRVAILGWVPDPIRYLRENDVYVLPSIGESSGSVSLLEAFQAGLPVIASRVDGIPEDVRDGDTGLLVPPGDVGALAGALRRLLPDLALRTRLGRRGREVYEERFSARHLVRALGAVYAELGFHGTLPVAASERWPSGPGGSP